MNLVSPSTAIHVANTAHEDNSSPPSCTAERFVPCDQVDIHPAAVRPIPVDLKSLEAENAALAASIREHGLLAAVIVRPVSDRFQLLDGTRRFKAVLANGRTNIRATVRPMTDSEAIEIIGVSNLMRREWDPIRRSEFIASLANGSLPGGRRFSPQEIARRFGRTLAWVKKAICLRLLPEPWRGKVASEELGESKARLLLGQLQKPAVLKAIAAHQANDRNAWRYLKDWQTNIDAVVEKFDHLHAHAWSEAGEIGASQSKSVGREVKAAKPLAWAEERYSMQCEELLECLVTLHKSMPDLDADETLCQDGAKHLLKPFYSNRESLRVISAVAAIRAFQLE